MKFMNAKSERHSLVRGVVAMLGFALATPAWAKDICSVPKSQWQSQSILVKRLEGEGWKIRNMKVDSGCYEVYGTDGSGKSRETHFNPATLRAVAEQHKNL